MSNARELAIREGKLTETAELDYILVDGSGSMQSKWWDFLAATQAYLDQTKANGVNSHLVIHVFDDSDLEMVQRDEPLATAKSVVEDPLGSHFMGTPLYDAIVMMGWRLRERDPKKASILIVTDGGDTGSILEPRNDVTQAKAILDWCRAKGWQVTFIGCDFNNDRQAAALGASEANSIGVQKRLLTDAAKNLATKRSAYSHDGSDIHFSADEKSKFGGLLTDQSNG